MAAVAALTTDCLPGCAPSTEFRVSRLPHHLRSCPTRAWSWRAIRARLRKGTDTGIDSNSGLFDNGHRKSTGLGEWLKAQGVTEVFVCGLATYYCVKFTALDAIGMGFKTHLIEENLRPDDVEHAVEEMKRAGVALHAGKSRPRQGRPLGIRRSDVHEVPLSTVQEWLEAQAKSEVLVDPKVYAGLYFINRST